MFLKSLTISTGADTIRKIDFHDGLNLIVDETPFTNDKNTGNNVGKTTVLMLVDFCLGGNAKNIYTDPENKKEEHKHIKNFLIEHSVLITLIMKEDLSLDSSREIRIERNFLGRKNQIRRVNGIDLTEEEFDHTLTNTLFPGHYGRKPTFRQIISHNIRYKESSVTQTLKTLDRYTRDDEYETLYLFLLGCDFTEGDSKQDLLAKIRIERSFKTRLEREQTRSAYETALSLLNEDIKKINEQKSTFNLNENFENDLQQLNDTKFKISAISAEISRFELRKDLINEATADMTSQVANIDHAQLKIIYQQAESYIGRLQKTFEDLCAFHDRMLSEKAKFIGKDLPMLVDEINQRKKILADLLGNEETLTNKIAKSQPFEELEQLIIKLNDKYREKGEYEKVLQQLDEVEKNLNGLEEDLRKIDDQLFTDDFEKKVKDQVHKFNLFFSSISNELYGEKYALKVDQVINNKGQRLYQFSSFNTNFSSGKKQGEISCFDIAYTLFADEENIPCYHFLLNDKKELMHDNQLTKIANLVNSKKIQFIASILRDKLPPELNDKKYFAVSLSQEDKLLRIEKYNDSN